MTDYSGSVVGLTTRLTLTSREKLFVPLVNTIIRFYFVFDFSYIFMYICILMEIHLHVHVYLTDIVSELKQRQLKSLGHNEKNLVEITISKLLSNHVPPLYFRFSNDI